MSVSPNTDSRDATHNMVIVHNFCIDYNLKSGRFYIKSKETAICPICHDELEVIGSRKRGVIEYEGSKKTLMIRRLYCKECNRIHHELPDIIVPYKRYTAEAIEKMLSCSCSDTEDYCCETSTIVRLKAWFFALRDYFQNALVSLRAVYNYDTAICKKVSEIIPLQNYDQLSTGWLKTLVRLLVNTNRWVQTRSA